METDLQIYQQGRLTFILTPHKIIVQTKHQSFFLNPSAYCWGRRVKIIRYMIELGEIRNLSELGSWCGTGVEWVHTQQKYEVDNLVPMSL